MYELPESYKYCPHCGMEIYNGKLMQDQAKDINKEA